MRKQTAKKLHNRDEVEVRVDGNWYPGYVLGTPTEIAGRILIPVQSTKYGWLPDIDHTDVR